MTRDPHVKVVIDARLVSGHHGGVEQVIIGLAHGLSQLDGDDEYLFLCHAGHSAWLEPYVSGPARVVLANVPVRTKLARRYAALAALLRRLRGRLRPGGGPPPVPPSDGTVERLAADVVHFPRQDGFLTEIPSVFHPHDLQHVHFPEFFSAEEIAQRELWYRTLCDQARIVSVTSEWGKRDLVRNLGIDAEKVAVVPLAPALAAYGDEQGDEDADRWLEAHGVAGPFVLFPSQTWPHKNHVRLIGAMARLRNDGLDVSLVCPGTQNDYFPEIWRAVEASELQERVRFLGYVSAVELQILYKRAACLAMPTLFEAAGGFGPIAEAFLAGLPVACSNVTSLPEQVGDAALVFDPLDESAIAEALRRLMTEPDLRAELVRRGTLNIDRFSWERTARTFRAYYRDLAGMPLSDTDRTLIEAPSDF